MKLQHALFAMTWIGLWLTPDQEGQRLLRQGDFEKAARAFNDPMWQGVAWYRAGEFEKATQAFSRISTPESHYNAGNAWLLLGKYNQAIASYNQALEQKPNWNQAKENRDIAQARAKMVEQKGEDLGDQELGADEIVFDKTKKSDGQDTEVAGEEAVTDATVQAIWLRNVQTRPADFLRAKFAYQQSQADSSEGP